MRWLLVVAAGVVIGLLPATALDGALPQSAIPYNDMALRSAIADGMSRAGAQAIPANTGTPDQRR